MQAALAAKINFHPMLPKQTAILGLKFTLRQSLLVCSDRKRRKNKTEKQSKDALVKLIIYQFGQIPNIQY